MDCSSEAHPTDVLADASEVFIRATTIEEILHALCTAVQTLANPDYCGIARMAENEFEVKLENYSPQPTTDHIVGTFPPGITNHLTVDHIETVYRTGCAEYLPDITQTRSAAASGGKVADSYRSLLIVPIDDWGVCLCSHSDANAFSSDTTDILETVCSLASTALEREQEIRRRTDRQESYVREISHDLRNPLSVARGFLDLIRADCKSEHISQLERALERMERLIDDLLVLSQAGRRTHTIEPIFLHELIEDCWFTVETGDADLRVIDDITLMADSSRLGEVFENLFGNAVEHGDNDVTVIVGALPTGFFVEDDGSGIPAADREDVFEAGYSTSDSGTGFGLHIVKQIIEAHGGEITVKEGSSGGARFEITNLEIVDE